MVISRLLWIVIESCQKFILIHGIQGLHSYKLPPFKMQIAPFSKSLPNRHESYGKFLFTMTNCLTVNCNILSRFYSKEHTKSTYFISLFSILSHNAAGYQCEYSSICRFTISLTKKSTKCVATRLLPCCRSETQGKPEGQFTESLQKVHKFRLALRMINLYNEHILLNSGGQDSCLVIFPHWPVPRNKGI